MEVELVQDKLKQIAVRGKKMKGQPSVQRCEAMAILEVVQSVPQGSQVHIHTDSKVTVQAIRSMCTKIYKKKRKIKNSNLIGQIVQTIRQKDVSAMIELVKSHEHYEGSDRNWINEYKEMGNEWAYRAAKEVVEQALREEDYNRQGWLLQEEQTGRVHGWRVLHKMMALKLKKEREQRLSRPVSGASEHGQGKYVEQVVTSCSLAMKWVKQEVSNIGVHYHILKYIMDRYATQDRIVRWKSKQLVQNKCVPCWLKEGVEYKVTKEHLWGV